jgi:UTP--glucose-1-phosphate uridylyltransferase
VATDNPDIVRVTELVEKPASGTAPSNLAVIGRYVINPAIFGLLENLAPGRGGEIQLTDALASWIDMPAESGGGVHAVVFRGKRYDTGDKLSYLKSVVSIALDREDLGPDLRAWLTSYLAGKI